MGNEPRLTQDPQSPIANIASCLRALDPLNRYGQLTGEERRKHLDILDRAKAADEKIENFIEKSLELKANRERRTKCKVHRLSPESKKALAEVALSDEAKAKYLEKFASSSAEDQTSADDILVEALSKLQSEKPEVGQPDFGTKFSRRASAFDVLRRDAVTENFRIDADSIFQSLRELSAGLHNILLAMAPPEPLAQPTRVTNFPITEIQKALSKAPDRYIDSKLAIKELAILEQSILDTIQQASVKKVIQGLEERRESLKHETHLVVEQIDHLPLGKDATTIRTRKNGLEADIERIDAQLVAARKSLNSIS